jgi:hypothetical protein
MRWHHEPLKPQAVYKVQEIFGDEYRVRSDEPLQPCQTCFREAKECLRKRVGVLEKACYCEPMLYQRR